FNTQKLDWINHHYMQEADSKRLAILMAERLEKTDHGHFEVAQLMPLVELFKERSHTINEMADLSLTLLKPISAYDEKSAQKAFKVEAIEPMKRVISHCRAVNDWSSADLH